MSASDLPSAMALSSSPSVALSPAPCGVNCGGLNRNCGHVQSYTIHSITPSTLKESSNTPIARMPPCQSDVSSKSRICGQVSGSYGAYKH